MSRRAVVILAVLIVVAVAALCAASALALGSASLSARSADSWRLQARALAWSGVQAALAELADQRRDLLVGRPPQLTESWELYAAANGRRAVVRLVPLAAGATTDAGARTEEGDLVASEAARLNLNTATPEMIAAVTGCDPSLASAIASGRPFGSVEDVLRVPGVPAGFLDEGDEPARALLTVFSADPNVQAGVGSGDESVGTRRLNLNTPWSDRLGRDLDARFGAGAGDTVKKLMGSGKKFRTVSELVANIRAEVALPVGAWAMPLDFLATTPDPFVPGGIDLMTASARVLSAVPGIGKDAAAEIVRAREGLGEESRRTPTWPATEGILDADAMQRALDHVVVRSMQWRVRVEAGLAPGEGDGPLERAMVMEAVLDVSSERPRVAYLREVGALDRVAREGTGTGERGRDGVDRAADEVGPVAPAAAERPEPGRLPTATGPTPPTTRPPTTRPPARPPVVRADTGHDSEREGGPGANLEEGGEGPTAVDRRIGRWTSPGEGSRR